MPEEERQTEGEDETEACADAGRPGEHLTTRWQPVHIYRQEDSKEEDKRDPTAAPQQKEWEGTRRLRSSAGTSLRGGCSNDVCVSTRMFNPGHTADASLVAGSTVGLSPLMNRWHAVSTSVSSMWVVNPCGEPSQVWCRIFSS